MIQYYRCQSKNPGRFNTPRVSKAVIAQIIKAPKYRCQLEGVTVQYLPKLNEHGETKQFVFSITRKVGSAVVRNKLRRRFRAIMTQVQNGFPTGVYFITIRKPLNTLNYSKLQDILLQEILFKINQQSK